MIPEWWAASSRNRGGVPPGTRVVNDAPPLRQKLRRLVSQGRGAGGPAIYRAAGIGCPTSFLRPPRIMRIDAGAFGETESASDLTGPTFSTSCALALDIAGLWSGN